MNIDRQAVAQWMAYKIYEDGSIEVVDLGDTANVLVVDLAPIFDELEAGRVAVDNDDPREDARLYKLFDDARQATDAHLAAIKGG